MPTLLLVEGGWEDETWAGQGGKSWVTESLGERGHPRGMAPPQGRVPGSGLGKEELGKASLGRG